jgi:regulator of sigma E protease
MSTVWALLAISVLIVVHETGHFVVARLCKMRVERFSLGFGPAILAWKRRPGGTQFQLAPILFGGFVEIKGMNIVEEVDPNDASAYPNRPVWQRFLTIFAGPATNYLFAIVLALGLFTCAGMQTRTELPYWQVTEISEGSPAAAKLQPGDQLIAIEGQAIDKPIADYIGAIGDRDAVFTIERDGTRMDVTMRPKQIDGAWRIGIVTAKVEIGRKPVGFGTALKAAIVYPVVQTKAIVVGLYEWATGKVDGHASSVVGITKIVSKTIEESWADTVALLMILNVYLGLFNLLPLPALDGGRLVFLGYEMVTRRRANPKFEATVHMVGVLCLIVLLAIVTYGDITRD